MKRKVTWLVAGLAISMTPANADVYVKVDAKGNAIGGAIMCDAATCGAGSQYSQLTLQEGERYVLQGVGVDYGVGNNNPDTRVSHDVSTNEWVIERSQTGGAEPNIERFGLLSPTPSSGVLSPDTRTDMDTKTVLDTVTATIDSTTATYDSATALLLGDWTNFPWWQDFLKMLTAWFSSLNWL